MGFKPNASLAAIAALGALAAFAPTVAKAQQTAYAIAGGGTTLITFNTNNAAAATTVGDFTLNGQPAFLDAIDFRPLNNTLYGYVTNNNPLTGTGGQTLYTVNLASGALIPVATGTGTGQTNTFNLGMDFNPSIDRVRIITDSDQNLVYNPNTSGSPTVATDVFYNTGDVNVGVNPNITDMAYSKNVGGAPFVGTTIQYAIDYGTDSLVTVGNNTGVLNTIGALTLNGTPVDTSDLIGFDIFTAISGLDTAYLTLNGDTTRDFYTVNLTNGALTSIGSVGGSVPAGNVYSLAVVPTAAVPEPGTVALLLTGLVGVGAPVVARRRKTIRAAA